VCYRLWSEDQHEGLAAYGSAEILAADLAGLALQLARWGVTPAPTGVARCAAELPPMPRPRTCWCVWGHSMTTTLDPPRPENGRIAGPSAHRPFAAARAGPGAGERPRVTSLRCWASAISCAVAVRTCTAVWRCCPARSARAAAKVACSGPSNWRGNTAGICAARPTQAVADPDHPRWLGALAGAGLPGSRGPATPPGRSRIPLGQWSRRAVRGG
jgi:ATP-dependent helicase HrpB